MNGFRVREEIFGRLMDGWCLEFFFPYNQKKDNYETFAFLHSLMSVDGELE